jgi:nitroreductase
MELKEMIFKRKSIRKYNKENLLISDIDDINSFIRNIEPLYKDIEVKFEVVSKNNVKSIFNWLSEEVIVAYSEDKVGCYENIGFMMQQLDLYLQSKGLGTCWIGLGKLDSLPLEIKNNNMKFIIMMTVGYHNEEFRNSSLDFKRNKLEEISDVVDERLEVARLAPSSINNQPWYFVHDENKIHMYIAYRNVFFKRAMENLLLIDGGIALAHLYVEHPNFKFSKEVEIKPRKGYNYLGSFTLD